MIILGIIIIVSIIAFTAWSLISNKPNKTGILILCGMTIFIGSFFIVNERATEIVIKEVGTIKMAAKQASNDAGEIHKLKTHLDSMFTLNPEGDVVVESGFMTDNIAEKTSGSGITFKSDAKFNKMTVAEDGGVVSLVDMSVSATPTEGTKESYSFDIDSNSIMQISAEADGAGGIKNKKLVCLSNLEIINPDNGVIMTSTNGKKWLLQMKNSGQLDITKF